MCFCCVSVFIKDWLSNKSLSYLKWLSFGDTIWIAVHWRRNSLFFISLRMFADVCILFRLDLVTLLPLPYFFRYGSLYSTGGVFALNSFASSCFVLRLVFHRSFLYFFPNWLLLLCCPCINLFCFYFFVFCFCFVFFSFCYCAINNYGFWFSFLLSRDIWYLVGVKDVVFLLLGQYLEISLSSKTSFGRNTKSAILIIFIGLYNFC